MILMKKTEYPIFTEEGKLMCRCLHDGNGNIELITKTGKMSLQEILTKALNPALPQKGRGKRSVRDTIPRNQDT